MSTPTSTLEFEGMQTDVLGKLRNIKLAPFQSLYPIFEAVVNSIQAIQELKQKNGEISIYITRRPELIDNEEYTKCISSVKIVDNGEGFIKANQVSFKKSDSTHKERIGGKGVGRFSWLKVFDFAKIDSKYKEGDSWRRYQVSFVARQNPFADESLQIESSGPSGATIVLENSKAEYSKFLCHDNDSLIFQIGSHILPYILTENPPKIWLIETESDGQEYRKNLTDFFKREYFLETRDTTKVHQGNTIYFTALILKKKIPKLYNTINYCGHSRLVITEEIKKYILDFSSSIFEETLGERSVVLLVKSDYLDSNVSQERVGFNIPSRRTGEQESIFPSIEELNELTIEVIKELFNIELSRIRTLKLQRINEIVNKTLPHYRFLLKHLDDFIDDIKLDKDDSLENQLYRIKNEIHLKTRKQAKEVLSKQKLFNPEKYNAAFKETMSSLNELTESSLLEFVVQKRIILDFLERILEWSDKEKFETEDQLHTLIFDMKTTSDEVDMANQNLWLIDERLSYHKYLVSDMQVRPRGERPDILIGNYDQALAYSPEKVENLQSSMVIVEFKRPGRDWFNIDEHPHMQVTNYIDLIREGKAKVKGRTIKVTEDCRFYCYIICDLSKEAIKFFRNTLNYRLTPDGMGLSLWTIDNVQIEVIPLDKLLRDAKQRNQMLFDKANIPLD